jgi:mRNA interferase MazF
MLINQGDIFWIKLDEPDGSEPDYAHPYVVVQEDIFNHSRIDSLVVCALTSNINQAKSPGNVLLDPGEANLLKQSVVVASKISAVSKSELGDYIGTLARQRIDQILAGIRFLQLMTEHQDSTEAA